jgi:hypothetical protein
MSLPRNTLGVVREDSIEHNRKTRPGILQIGSTALAAATTLNGSQSQPMNSVQQAENTDCQDSARNNWSVPQLEIRLHETGKFRRCELYLSALVGGRLNVVARLVRQPLHRPLLAGELFQVSDDFSAFIGFDKLEGHIAVRNELLWAGQPFVERGGVPSDMSRFERI